MLIFFANSFVPLDIEDFESFVFVEPVDEKVKPPSLNVSNFRCVEKKPTWCFINKTSSSCPRCLNFTLVNTSTVNCIICEKAMIDVFVNWTKPKTFSPIIKYNIAYGGKITFLSHPPQALELLPVSIEDNI